MTGGMGGAGMDTESVHVCNRSTNYSLMLRDSLLCLQPTTLFLSVHPSLSKSNVCVCSWARVQV